MKNELPSTFKAYRYQQHRWSCGPANLFKKMIGEIMRTKVWLILNMLKLWIVSVFFPCNHFVWCCCFFLLAESHAVEEVVCDLQFLFRPENCCTYCHICILLRPFAGNCFVSWSWSSQMGSCLYSFHHHSP